MTVKPLSLCFKWASSLSLCSSCCRRSMAERPLYRSCASTARSPPSSRDSLGSTWYLNLFSMMGRWRCLFLSTLSALESLCISTVVHGLDSPLPAVSSMVTFFCYFTIVVSCYFIILSLHCFITLRNILSFTLLNVNDCYFIVVLLFYFFIAFSLSL